MEKKNMVLLTVIAVATLLVAVVGATFAYFTATVNDNFTQGGQNGQTDIKSGNVAGTLTFAAASSNAGKFTATDVYPGHAEVATIKVTASGSQGQQSAIKLGYSVTQNDFNSGDLKVYVFKSNEEITLESQENSLQCVKQSGSISDGDDGANTKLFETCTHWTDKDINKLKTGGATLIGEQNGINVPQSNSTILVNRDVITVDDDGSTDAYYYVVIEFVNSESSQNDTSMNKTLDGEITITAA